MGSHLKLCALAIVCTLAFGCAKKNSVDENIRGEHFRQTYEAAFNKNQDQTSRQLLSRAKSAIGTPYVRGGTTPAGFDCSGFVSWAYKSIGVALPRTAREQSVIGQRISKQEDMRAGDIVAFRHPRRGYHTGIYVGDGKFIHSPHRRTSVRITSLDDPYFSKSFLSARRVNVEGSENLVAQAESRLNDYTEEKTLRELSGKKKSSGKPKANMKSRRESTGKTVHVASVDTKKHNKINTSSKIQAKTTKSTDTKKIAKTPNKNKPRETVSAEKRKTSSDSKKVNKKL
jgi:hypothetical protein